MRDLLHPAIDRYRVTDDIVRNHYGTIGGKGSGVFRVPSPVDFAAMLIIAATGMDWDHVSVSRRNRTPNWREMDYVKRLFFQGTETAMQLHVPVDDHINAHPHCLHLWRPQKDTIPLPPKETVA